MIAGYKQLIDRAHDKGIKVIGAPHRALTRARPTGQNEGEAARTRINEWIIKSGDFDGVVRLDTAFADPADPRQMREGYTWAITCMAAMPG